MEYKSFNIMLDIKQNNKNDYIEVVQGDLNTNVLEINLTNGNKNYDLTDLNIEIAFSKPDGTTVLQEDINKVNAKEGRISCVLKTNTIAAAGKVKAEVRVLDEDNSILTSSRFEFYVRKSLVSDDTIESTNEFSVLDNMLKEVEFILEKYKDLEVNEDNRQELYQLMLQLKNDINILEKNISINEKTRELNENERINLYNSMKELNNKLVEMKPLLDNILEKGTELINNYDNIILKLEEIIKTNIELNQLIETNEKDRVINENLRIKNEEERVSKDSERDEKIEKLGQNISHVEDLATEGNFTAINKVENGSFKDNAAGWRLRRDMEYYIKDGTMFITKTGSANHQVEQEISVEVDNVYYVSTIMKSTVESAIYLSGGIDGFITHSQNGNYERLSLLYTADSNKELTVRFLGSNHRGVLSEPIELSKPIFINLTKTFGKGNEPSVNEMDEIISYIPNEWFEYKKSNFITMQYMYAEYRKNIAELRELVATRGLNR